jgi:hypothetical protein
MADVQSQLNQLIADFVDQVTTLARQTARDLLDRELSSAGRRVVLNGRGKGVKRTSTVLAKLGEKLIEYVKEHPGLRIEQINEELGTSTRDLALPIRKLISDGMLRTEGAKRSTKYFIGSGRKRGKRKKKD